MCAGLRGPSYSSGPHGTSLTLSLFPMEPAPSPGPQVTSVDAAQLAAAVGLSSLRAAYHVVPGLLLA